MKTLGLLALLATQTVMVQAAMAQGAPPAPDKPVSSKLISLAEATHLAQDTIAACAARHETVAVYVTDADAHIRVAMSADELNPVGLHSVTGKTAAVLAFKQPTRALFERLAKDPAFRDGPGKDPRYFFHPGALPLYRAGLFVGVLAAGGGHDKDEECGLEALSHQSALTVHP